MPRIVKWLLWALVPLALYASLKILMPYIRFADIKGKMKEAEQVISDIPPTIPQGSIIYNTLGDRYARNGEWAGAIRNSRMATPGPALRFVSVRSWTTQPAAVRAVSMRLLARCS